MSTSEFPGVAGFFIALVSVLVTAAHIAWQVWWQHRQDRELVRVLVATDPQPHVLVHNFGTVPVYLTGVDLVVDGQRVPLLAVYRQAALPQEVGKPGAVVWQTTGHTTYPEPLQRGDAHPFVLPVPPKAFKKAYISVTSNAGEIRRLRGKRVVWLLEGAGKS